MKRKKKPGRPPQGKKAKEKVHITLDPDLWKTAQRHGNASAFINAAVRHFLQTAAYRKLGRSL